MNPVSVNLTLLFQIVSFLILLWLANRFLSGPISRILRERQERIQQALAAADRAREEAAAAQQAQAEELAHTRAEAHAILAAARETAERVRDEQLDLARAEAARLVERARQAIDQERDQAKQQLRAYAVELTIEATRRVIGATLDSAGQHQLIASTIDELAASRGGRPEESLHA